MILAIAENIHSICRNNFSIKMVSFRVDRDVVHHTNSSKLVNLKDNLDSTVYSTKKFSNTSNEAFNLVMIF